MKDVLAILFTVVFSYLFGSLNSAIIVCRLLKKQDIRDYGSKNAGLTNVLRVYGKGPALATLLCDLAKGVIAVVVCRLLVHKVMGVEFFGDPHFIGYVAGLFVMLGHCFPVFYGFHGGKGVLLAATTLLAIDPLTCVCALAVFGILLAPYLRLWLIPHSPLFCRDSSTRAAMLCSLIPLWACVSVYL